MNIKDRRRFTRVPFSSEAILKTSEGRVRGTVENLSLNGAFFKMTESLPVGSAVEVEIFLVAPASDISVVLSGSVVRHAPDGLAVGFSGMYLGDFEHLRDAVANSLGDRRKVVCEFLRYMARSKSKCL